MGCLVAHIAEPAEDPVAGERDEEQGERDPGEAITAPDRVLVHQYLQDSAASWRLINARGAKSLVRQEVRYGALWRPLTCSLGRGSPALSLALRSPYGFDIPGCFRFSWLAPGPPSRLVFRCLSGMAIRP